MAPYREAPQPSGCPCCGSRRLGLLEQLADDAAAGVSYRSAGAGRRLLAMARNQGELRVSDADRPAYFAKSWFGRWLDRALASYIERPSKFGTLEALVCGRCGRVAYRVQDVQWIEWDEIESFKPLTAEMSAMRRRQGESCRNCQSKKLGVLASLPDTVGEESSFTDQALGVDQDGQRVGKLQAIVCCDCGDIEVFVADPRSIDFESLVGFSWLE